MKKIVTLLMLLCTIAAVIPASASAETRYCPVCDTTQNWTRCCTNNKSGASAYGLCGDVANCNWYTIYRFYGEKCPSCSNVWTLSEDHACEGLHSVTVPSHNYKWCVYR